MKKSISRVVAIMMCIAVVLSVFSPITFAAKETIWEVMVGYYAPVDGETIYRGPYCYNGGCNTDVYYNYDNFVESVRAYDLTTGTYLDADDLVTAGHQYKIEILVKPENGYQFVDYNGKPNVNAKIRSTGVSVSYLNADVSWYDSKSIILSYVYVVSKREIVKNVSITVTPPKDGEYPDYTSIISTDNINVNYNFNDGDYIINGIQWAPAPSVESPLHTPQPIGKDIAFKGGNRYRLTMDIVAVQDYAEGIERVFKFEDSPYLLKDNILVNGSSTYARISYDRPGETLESQNCIRITKDFFCPFRDKVSEVSIEADPPMVGNSPDFAVAMGEAEKYKLVDYNEDGFIRGVKWHNNTTGGNLKENDVFKLNNSYSLVLYLQPADDETIFTKDYWGDTTVTATINGNEAYVSNAIMVDQNASHAIEVEYRFENVSNILTRMAVLGIEKPLPGNTPDYDAIVKNELFYNFNTSGDSEYTINGISWHNDTLGDYMLSTDKFEVGGDYTVCIDLLVSDEYAVNNTTSFGVNDAEATLAMMIAGTKKVRLTYDFGEVEPYKTKYNIARNLDVPVEGECPDYTLELGNSESRINSVRWYDVSAMQAIELSANSKFAGGHTYQVELNLTPGENYAFATNDEGEAEYAFDFEFGSFVNCATNIEGDKNEVIVTYTFNVVPITKIELEFDEPVPGFEPMNYAVSSSDAYTGNDVVWYDKTDGVYMDVYRDVFVEDHVYVATVDVFAVGRAMFDYYADNFSATVNGLSANVGTVYYEVENSDVIDVYSTLYAVRVTYEFAPCKIENFLEISYDEWSGNVTVSHIIYQDFEKGDVMAYIAYYDQDGRVVSVSSKEVEWANDIYGEQAPQDATYCKAMIWYKNTCEPLCDVAGFSL